MILCVVLLCVLRSALTGISRPRLGGGAILCYHGFKVPQAKLSYGVPVNLNGSGGTINFAERNHHGYP